MEEKYEFDVIGSCGPSVGQGTVIIYPIELGCRDAPFDSV